MYIFLDILKSKSYHAWNQELELEYVLEYFDCQLEFLTKYWNVLLGLTAQYPIK